ncbi:hypothetical protein [Dactylosporangium matsuzakiense]|nr:hypothetical protein [Dactylosporangium matsuzakiense]
MTLPNDDMSNIADPGAFEPDEVDEPDAGDLDEDHRQLGADPLRGAGQDAARTGAPLGPPD